VGVDHCAILELVLAALDGFREINGMHLPDILSTSSCLQLLLKLVCVSVGWTACVGGARGLWAAAMADRPPARKPPASKPPASNPPAIQKTACLLEIRPPVSKPLTL
jgi:hypothetical protein